MVKVEYNPATPEDVRFVGERLREADRAEVLALGVRPEVGLRMSAEASDYVWCGWIGGVPSMIFGCSRNVLSERGEVWALGTDNCTGHPREMLIYGRRVLRMMLDIFPVLENYCDARYEKSLRWLKKIGFTIGDPEPYGVNGALFCHIMAKKEGVKSCVS